MESQKARNIAPLLICLAFLPLGCKKDKPAPPPPVDRPVTVPASPTKLFPVVKDGAWGYIDVTGRVVIPFRFQRA